MKRSLRSLKCIIIFIVFLLAFLRTSKIIFYEEDDHSICFAKKKSNENEDPDAIKSDEWDIILKNKDDSNNNEFSFIQKDESVSGSSVNDNKLYYFLGIAMMLIGVLGAFFSSYSIIKICKNKKFTQ
ncbi:MAG: hypothetical protein LBT82_02995 [Oscillospiraceae bacterium]|nr:hypothetical protein [Oscillospiraceae bacterium]